MLEYYDVMVIPLGFEPRTHGLKARCFYQLSYEIISEGIRIPPIALIESALCYWPCNASLIILFACGMALSRAFMTASDHSHRLDGSSPE